MNDHGAGSSVRTFPARTPVLLGLAAAAASAVYVKWLRPWQLSWGATEDEVSRVLPGDDLVASPTFLATRAITIGAPASGVWPWLVQVGVGRAGWYSYDRLDNLGRPSARRIIPELQSMSPGDLVPMSPDGKQGVAVLAVDEPHVMLWGEPAETTWVWCLDESAPGVTRLVTRVRSRWRWRPSSIGFSALLEFGDIWMMRKMLLSLRERAEAAPSSSATTGGSPATGPTPEGLNVLG